uniref:Uncharacterized protein n=1 Tax=Kalanchoe fedtschenkoi TaxID=63787 RepID=A0A7N0V8G0_KALFE
MEIQKEATKSHGYRIPMASLFYEMVTHIHFLVYTSLLSVELRLPSCMSMSSYHPQKVDWKTPLLCVICKLFPRLCKHNFFIW